MQLDGNLWGFFVKNTEFIACFTDPKSTNFLNEMLPLNFLDDFVFSFIICIDIIYLKRKPLPCKLIIERKFGETFLNGKYGLVFLGFRPLSKAPREV